ncbi:RTA1-domain-containing protein [Hyaloscypha variabilis F]|uniref:RTA1-domain-containing protein n=1 Tax=Hyaloscypha variabilis (strain UAMH 11265 / GT02V1 / F) TaxID=1149755 RepID=A0A2J6R2M3_HYAVF|nr:RTA1-domain-containing protein [Hyaloscypha variabilis F]
MSGDVSTNYTVNANGTLDIFVKGRETLFIPTDGLTGYNQYNNTAYGNLTLLADQTLCNLNTCDLTLAAFDYRASLPGNALYAAIFGIYLLLNIYLGIRHKTWGYMVAMTVGLCGEIIGYIGRILLWKNPFDPTGNDFLIYIVCLTISPALISAAIYLCLARIVVVFGEDISRFRPRTYTLIFCSCDLFSLVLQALGGGMTSSAHTYSAQQTGINIMLAGLSAQVISLFIFSVMALEYAFRLYRHPTAWDTRHAALYESKLFQAFLWGLAVATVTIFTRSTFRVAELSGGFHGSLANNQVSFMILEGAMVTIACSCLTLLHPGIAFQGRWTDANFKFRAGKSASDLEKTADSGDSQEGVAVNENVRREQGL